MSGVSNIVAAIILTIISVIMGIILYNWAVSYENNMLSSVGEQSVEYIGLIQNKSGAFILFYVNQAVSISGVYGLSGSSIVCGEGLSVSWNPGVNSIKLPCTGISSVKLIVNGVPMVFPID